MLAAPPGERAVEQSRVCADRTHACIRRERTSRRDVARKESPGPTADMDAQRCGEVQYPDGRIGIARHGAVETPSRRPPSATTQPRVRVACSPYCGLLRAVSQRERDE